MSLVASGYGSDSEGEPDRSPGSRVSTPAEDVGILLGRSTAAPADLPIEKVIVVASTQTPAPREELSEEQTEDAELALRRRLLEPTPFADAPFWGIPPEGDDLPSEALQAKVEKFHDLMAQGIRFNARLESNRAFRNPKIHAELIVHAGINEYGSHLSRPLPTIVDLPAFAHADRILEAQRERAEAISNAPPRSHIPFTAGR